MKLFTNQLRKIQFLFLLAFIVIEIICFVILYISYKPLFLQVYNQSREITKEKTRAITHTLSQIFELSFHRYIHDLKLIGKHMSFLANNEINNKSQFYQNLINDEDKHIYFATIENLKNYFNQYYDDTQKRFLFFENYIKDFVENSTNQKNVINDLMNKEKHPELNSISYYKLNGNINDTENDKQKMSELKYLISILKTIFINRFLVKGNNFEISRYYLIKEDEIFIYPPEPYNNTLIYSLKDYIYCFDDFPQCYFDYFIDYIYYLSFDFDFYGYNIPIIPVTNPKYEEIMNTICLSIPFDKNLQLYDFYENAIICMDINMTIILQQKFFQSEDEFNFFLFSIIPYEVSIFYSDKNEMYEQIRKIFNDTKFGIYSLGENDFRFNQYYNLFQFLYLEIFKEPELLKDNNLTIDYIIEEYEIIQNKIFDEMFDFMEDDNQDHFIIDIQKTTCKSDLYYNGKKCIKDNFLLIAYKLNSKFNYINEFFIDDPDKSFLQPIFFSMSIINNNPNYMKWKINIIIVYKMIKLFIFFIIASLCLIILYFIFIKIFFEVKFNLVNKILLLLKGDFFDSKNINKIVQKKEEILIEPNNKEMTQIKNLFDILITILSLKIKINFEQKEIILDNVIQNSGKTEKNIKNKNNQNKNINNKNNIGILNEYKNLIKKINNDEARIMLAFVLIYNHFKKRYFEKSEIEFKNLINEINKYQNTLLTIAENNNSKLKDTISRCSKISYLNEYSLTNELNETTLPLIKIKLLTQKIYYLYAMSIYNQEKIRKNKAQKYNKENNNMRLKEAIEYFTEAKNISILLGIDTIRQIFSTIMISKCFNELKNYKESITNINEALLLFSDLQNTFKDKSYFNPKIMIFVENFIFQNIMLSMAQTTFNFNKYPQSCWILMKIIETSPIIFNNIHFQVCSLFFNCLNQIENLCNIPIRQIDKYKTKINKLLKRINIKLNNNLNIDKNNKYINNNKMNSIISIPSIKNNQVTIPIESLRNIHNSNKLNKNKYILTNNFSTSLNSLNHSTKNQYKNITLCISEKLLQNINEEEFKFFIIKCYKKYFSNSIENDKFSFIQFSNNGKKTISIKSQTIEIFLQKLEENIMAFQINEIYKSNNNIQIQFMEFSNILMNIIKSHKQENFEDKCDNIIIIFINTCDIRFNNHKECVDTINELNNNNYSIIIFTYDTEIEEEKIEGIFSFIYGLNDGHFFQIKNYQQISQVFANFSVKDSQQKFIDYNYEITDFNL